MGRGLVIAILATAGANTYFLWSGGRPTLAVLVGALFPLAALANLWLTLREPDATAMAVAGNSLISLLVFLLGFALALE